MYPRLRFNESAIIYSPTPNDYGKDILGLGTTVKSLFEQTTGFRHGGNQDAIISDSRLYLDAQNDFVANNYHRLEGMVVKINPFGADDGDQYFRITSATPARDILRKNKVRHVECELEKTDDFDNED